MATYQAGGKFGGRSFSGGRSGGSNFQGGQKKEKVYFAANTVKVRRGGKEADPEAKLEKVFNLLAKIDGSSKAPSITLDDDAIKALQSLKAGDQLVLFFNEPKKD
jgi:hypothetical protein